jgi:hypothetical protein
MVRPSEGRRIHLLVIALAITSFRPLFSNLGRCHANTICDVHADHAPNSKLARIIPTRGHLSVIEASESEEMAWLIHGCMLVKPLCEIGVALPETFEKEAEGEYTFRVTGESMFAMTNNNHHNRSPAVVGEIVPDRE